MCFINLRVIYSISIFRHPPNLTSCFIQKRVLQSLLKVYMNKPSSIVRQQVNYTTMEWFLFYCSIGSIKRQNICQDAANIDIIHTFKVQDVRQVNENQISFENFECFDKYLQKGSFSRTMFCSTERQTCKLVVQTTREIKLIVKERFGLFLQYVKQYIFPKYSSDLKK